MILSCQLERSLINTVLISVPTYATNDLSSQSEENEIFNKNSSANALQGLL
jgi:hypothetical protein